MSAVQCFWTEPADRVTQALRRFVYSDEAKCPSPYGYHNAETSIGEAPVQKSAEGYISSPAPAEFAGDLRWPTHCPCGYAFTDADQWQVFVVRIYRTLDGREWPMRMLPPGAMYDATWYHDVPNMVGPDGIALVVVLPPDGNDNWWHVDGRANNNPAPQGWQRTGTVKGPNPTVTANPSILTPRYHGWLRNGVLVEC